MDIKELRDILSLYAKVAWHYACLKGRNIDMKNEASRSEIFRSVEAGHFTLDTVLENNEDNIKSHGPPLIKFLYELGHINQAEKIADQYGLPLEINVKVINADKK